jgi:hypothetical protein
MQIYIIIFLLLINIVHLLDKYNKILQNALHIGLSNEEGLCSLCDMNSILICNLDGREPNKCRAYIRAV